MFDKFLAWLIMPGSLTTLMLVIVFSFIFGVFIQAQFKGKLNWLDLVCRGKQRSVVSLSKVLQLVGGIVATWVVVKSTILSEGNISWEIFTAYLAYVGSVEAYGKYITMKNGGYEGEMQDNARDNYNQKTNFSNNSPNSSATKRRTIQNDVPILGGDNFQTPDDTRVGGAKAID